MKRRIAVLFHEDDRQRDLSCYVIFHLAELWRGEGLDVVFVYGVREFVPADVALLHIDLSVVPREYVEFANRYPVALNRNATDIRKSTLSRILVRPGDGFDGPVIVKSDLNYAGSPERELDRVRLAAASPLRRRVMQWRRSFRRPDIEFGSSWDYRIYDGRDQVPAGVWRDDRYVVERFLPERDGDRFVLRCFHFLGDVQRCTWMAGEHPIVGAAVASERRQVAPHPDMVALRHELGFDYGKFDYAIHDGRAVLFDANKTTGMGAGTPQPRHKALWADRMKGIYAYL